MRYNKQYKKRERINRYISSPTVRLIGSDGKMVGIKSTYDALAMAKEGELDLVEISPQAKPPVCKIMDYSKYKYEKDKQNRENKKKQKSASFKEIKIHPRIASHDLQTKINHIKSFLESRHKVRVAVVFHGRENQHKDLGFEILNNVKETLINVGSVDGKINKAGNTVSLVMSPKAH